MKNIILTAFSVILLSSCTEEMNFDYHTIVPIDVIEAYLTQDSLKITISETQDMYDENQYVKKDADVILMDETGHVLTQKEQPVVGMSYTINVTINGKTYTSSSIMQQPTTIESATFNWDNIGGVDHLYYKLRVNDIKHEDNYYCYRMIRNGKVYKWGVFSDTGYKDDVIEVTINCMSRDTYKDNKPEDQNKILHDSDKIHLEVLTIDRKAYDYLYSLNLSRRQNYNPLPNFTGGCMGYFIAAGITSHDEVYHYSE